MSLRKKLGVALIAASGLALSCGAFAQNDASYGNPGYGNANVAPTSSPSNNMQQMQPQMQNNAQMPMQSSKQARREESKLAHQLGATRSTRLSGIWMGKNLKEEGTILQPSDPNATAAINQATAAHPALGRAAQQLTVRQVDATTRNGEPVRLFTVIGPQGRGVVISPSALQQLQQQVPQGQQQSSM